MPAKGSKKQEGQYVRGEAPSLSTITIVRGYNCSDEQLQKAQEMKGEVITSQNGVSYTVIEVSRDTMRRLLVVGKVQGTV